MSQQSRVKNAIKNVGIASILQVFTLVLSFASRTIFVRLLGNDYLSCDGLFSNILTILSFSELGIGSAIIYSLYKPIAENDRVTIGKLMNLIRVAYNYIAIIIIILGLLVVPFLGNLVNDVPEIEEDIRLLYVLFLANTVASYILGYKRSFLVADQQNYIVLLIQQLFHVIRIVGQIIALLLTHNYIMYLIVMIICTLATNIFSTYYTDKKNTWLKEYSNAKMTREEIKPIFSNISSIVQYKFGSVILNGTDNIVISLILHTSLVGLCSNYNLIINSIQSVCSQGMNGLMPTIGNSNVSMDEKQRYSVFKQLYFISIWAFGFVFIALTVLLTPFVENIWLGGKYTLPSIVVFSMTLSFFVFAIDFVPSSYRTTMGYFKEARVFPLLASGANIALDIILGKSIGLSGIFFATAITRAFFFNIVDGYLIYKKCFKVPFMVFLKDSFIYIIVIAFGFCLTTLLAGLINENGFVIFIIKCFISFAVPNLLFFIIFRNSVEFKNIKRLIGIRIKSRRKKDE